ncbi:MAG TPA: AMP-binding protein [Mycobacteriales bacterium]|nr:AMP-binding protein [Mycobacteriales bacterium]
MLPSALDPGVSPWLAARVLVRSGLIRPVRPDKLLGMCLSLAQWRTTPAAAYAAAAAHVPDRLAVIDEHGASTFAEIDRRSSQVAAGLRRRGVVSGDRVALLVRNSADFVVAEAALSKLGVDLVYLNTGAAPPQIADVLDRERVVAVIADREFADSLRAAAGERLVVLTGSGDDGRPTLASLVEDTSRESGAAPLPPVARAGRHVIMTSGTTGRPKGAERETPGGAAGIGSLVALLSAIPLRAREVTVLAAPMFHSWGFANFTLSMVLETTLVLDRKFDPERTLARVQEHRAQVLVAVPVMLQRILELPPEARRRYDTSSLRVIAVSGSAVPVGLAERVRDEFGDVLYNLYGSTEVAAASVATPEDMRVAPGSVGHPLSGVQVSILDGSGAPLPTGQSGRIFVGSSLAFRGYTGGGDKDRVGGLVATGDVGHLDRDGRLWVDGRDDEMIVSGGENVFPAEVEECLRAHPEVADVAVVGVPDEKFGARLVAHVVFAGGASGADGDALRDYVRQRLAGYKVPRDVVLHDELPRNETGKVVKRQLTGP